MAPFAFLTSSRIARISRTALVLSSSAAVMLGSTVQAQIVNQYGGASGMGAGNSSPYGSPLDPYGTASQSGVQSSPYGNTNMTTSTESSRISPVEIGSDSTASGADYGSSNSLGTSTLTNSRDAFLANLNANTAETTIKRPALPNEFEKFVEKTLGKKLPRFGADLIIPSTRDFATPATTTVPSTYVMNPGDQITIGLSGSIDGSLDAEINTDGEIFLPKVGPIKLTGVTYGNLRPVLMRALGKQYRDFRLSVTMARLRGIRVYVTGFANNPGAYTVNSLSTMVNAVFAAGGPASGGSFRSVKLYRNGELVSNFDLYDFIRGGDKSKDVILQNQDVLYIAPVGPQIAITGSTNQEAIFEAKPGESVDSLLRFAGGASVLADTSRVILYRISDRVSLGGIELPYGDLSRTAATGGDIIQVLSQGSLIQPLARQSVIVRIEGEVNKPGNYYVAPNTSLDEAMALAGGLTSKAFVYGTNFQRVSVGQQQRESFKEAIKQLEISLAAAPLTRDSSIDPTASTTQIGGAQATLARLKDAEPDGRVVLDIAANSTTLPGPITLENNDRIYIPARPTTVGVFGAVYRPASFMIGNGKTKKVGDYLNMAGGPLRAGDRGQTFVVRANGAVIPKSKGALSAPVLPGDVIFVPVKTQSGTVWAKIQQISTVLFQLGITAAAFVALSK